jgi:two-component system response regulator YesN
VALPDGRRACTRWTRLEGRTLGSSDTKRRAAEEGPKGLPADDRYPWSREREALEALEDFDLGRCRWALEHLAHEIALPDEEHPGTMAVLLSDLLETIRSSLQPEGPPKHTSRSARADHDGRAERWRRAEALGTAGNMGDLRQRFQQEVNLLFAPLVSGATVSPTVLRARAYLDRNFTRRITLGELAKAIHLSPNYLSSIFRRELGVTVTQYLRRRRMRLAEQLLMEGKHTISEVAYQVGYQNYRDFHRNFVREGKRSPRAFQRLCRSRRRGLQAAGSPSPAE